MESYWNTPEKVDLIRLIAQWLAVISTSIALLFAMRYSILKKRADDLLQNKIEIGQQTIHELNQLREYNEVATWNYQGAQSISKDYSLPGPLSGWVDGYVRDAVPHKQVRFDDAAIDHFKEILKKYPKYPFPYYFLAEAFRLRGDNILAESYAKQCMDILQITTKIPNHSPDHDDALKNLKSLLDTTK
jgi:hypothetical protein